MTRPPEAEPSAPPPPAEKASPVAVSWRDNEITYGRVSRVLHWVMAGLILWQFTGMILKITVGRSPVVSFFVGSHQPVGFLIFLLVTVRLVWALLHYDRRPPHHTGVVGLASRAGHLALYALMVIVPLLGLFRAWGNGRGFDPFGITVFPATGVRVGWAVAPANLLHAPLAWLLLALIAGHVAMAIWHHFVWKDGLLLRMAGRARG